MPYAIPSFARPKSTEQKESLEQRLTELEQTPWLLPGVRYEPFETGVTCGHADHDPDCLCDVSIGPKSEIQLGLIHELAHLSVNNGSRFRTGAEFANFLETVVTFAAAGHDYCAAAGMQNTRSAQDPISNPGLRDKLIGFLAAGNGWPFVRQWLTVNGYESETRTWSRSLHKHIAKWRKHHAVG